MGTVGQERILIPRLTYDVIRKYDVIDVMHAQNDVNYMPVGSEAGTPICGPFLTTNGCIDVYDLKGKLR